MPALKIKYIDVTKKLQRTPTSRPKWNWNSKTARSWSGNGFRKNVSLLYAY